MCQHLRQSLNLVFTDVESPQASKFPQGVWELLQLVVWRDPNGTDQHPTAPSPVSCLTPTRTQQEVGASLSPWDLCHILEPDSLRKNMTVELQGPGFGFPPHHLLAERLWRLTLPPWAVSLPSSLYGSGSKE